jgi:hypothetical protein
MEIYYHKAIVPDTGYNIRMVEKIAGSLGF